MLTAYCLRNTRKCQATPIKRGSVVIDDFLAQPLNGTGALQPEKVPPTSNLSAITTSLDNQTTDAASMWADAPSNLNTDSKFNVTNVQQPDESQEEEEHEPDNEDNAVQNDGDDNDDIDAPRNADLQSGQSLSKLSTTVIMTNAVRNPSQSSSSAIPPGW